MSMFNNMMMVVQKALAGYNIANAALFDGSTGYLSRTFGTPTNAKKWAKVGWIQLTGQNANTQALIASYTSSNTFAALGVNGATGEFFFYTILSFTDYGYVFTPLMRDYTGWVPYLFNYDSATDTYDLFLDGVVVPKTATYGAIPTNHESEINKAIAHDIGRYQDTPAYMAAYIAQDEFIDGENPAWADVFELDLATGNWVAKAYTGTYGTNGSLLDFSNVADLGEDQSGNGNDWAENGTITQVTSTPTNNHWVWNSLYPTGGVRATKNNSTLSNGNLTASQNGGGDACGSTFLMPQSGDYCLEINNDAGETYFAGVGIAGDVLSQAIYYNNGVIVVDGGTTQSGLATTDGIDDVLGVRVTDGEVQFYVNGASQGSTETMTGAKDYIIFASDSDASGGHQITANNTLESMAYIYGAAKALSTDNLPAMTATDKNVNSHVHTELVNHDGTSTAFTLNWDADVYHTYFEIKNRDNVENWFNVDTLRGITKILNSNGTLAEATDANIISVSGTTVTLGSTLLNDNYVVTCKKAGLIGSETSGTTDDGKAYEYSVNTDLGFCITLYTGSGLAGHSIPHGHGKAYGYSVTKRRDTGTFEGTVYHASLGATKYLVLDTTAAAGTSTAHWNDTEPTSAVSTRGTANSVNANNGTYVEYSSAESDFIKIGSYTGNGNADGPFVNEMISPVWSLIKNTTHVAQSWLVNDETRSPYNPVTASLNPNSSTAESSIVRLDYTSPGIKIRINNNTENEAGAKHIYLMFGQPTGASNADEAPGR